MQLSDGLTVEQVIHNLRKYRKLTKWFTKNFEEAILVERAIIKAGYGYTKTVDMSQGFQATFQLGDEDSRYWG